jgi:Zn-dependent metalloprotease
MHVSARLRVLFCLVGLTGAALAAQTPADQVRRPGLIAVHATTPIDLREWDTRINQMVRGNQLVVVSSRPDPDISGRTHESLAQYHRGIPVFGASLSRQTAQGVSVSVIGGVFEDVSVDSSAAMSATQAVRRLAEAVGAQPVGDGPRSVIFPNLDGAYRHAYLVTMSDTNTYIVDAVSGHVLWTIEETQTQGEIGAGTGSMGDAKKMSTTQVAGAFRAHDQLRPAPIRTFDTRGSDVALNRLLQPPGAAVDGDFSVDADNTWADPAVVDTHAHTGWMEDYLFKQVGWTGIDNRRGTITSAVHAGLVNNAFFIAPPFGADGRGMFVYGRTPAGVPMTSLDIVAHEMMHGVTNAALVQRTGNGLFGSLFVDRFGPSAVTFGGSSLSCDSAVFNFSDGRQLPILCNAGRYVLVSNHGGAINEGFSDVFGIAAEFFHHPVGTGALQADYRMGEDITGLGASRAADVPASRAIGSSLGAMPYPDHVSRLFSFVLAIVQGTRSNPISVTPLPWVVVGDQLATLPTPDSGGVHLNSTILSHAFYLAVEGGRNATSGVTVQGVGAANRLQIERVFFRAMTVMMPNVPSMQAAAQATVQAAVDLYGPASSAAVATRQAMQAVGLM